ncbi:MAG: hypothetical protein ACJAS3_002862 [Roseivirga sp.]|jgi:hypothetical protein
MKFIRLLSVLLFYLSCSSESLVFMEQVKLQSIEGTVEYLDSPFLTPGDRAYMVGTKMGTFQI